MLDLPEELRQLLTLKTGTEIAAKGIVGLGTFLLGAGARWAWTWIRARYAAIRANQLWRTMLDAHVVVVMSVFGSPDDLEFEQTGLMGVGDARALTTLEVWFKSIRFSDYEIQYADDIKGEVLGESNLICIGGPDANSIARDAIDKLRAMNVIKRPNFPETHCHQEGAGQDYAVVCFVPSPYGDKKRLLLLLGETSGYGTWAATKSVTARPVAMPKFGPGGFSAFLSTDVVRKRPQQTRLVDFRPIAEPSRAERRR